MPPEESGPIMRKPPRSREPKKGAPPPTEAPPASPRTERIDVLAGDVQVRPVPDDEWRERRRVEPWPDKWQVTFRGSRLLTRPTLDAAAASGRQCALDRRCDLALLTSRGLVRMSHDRIKAGAPTPVHPS